MNELLIALTCVLQATNPPAVSSNAVVSVPVGFFFRVVGSETALHTRVLSPAHDAVAAGYYEATNLAQVDADLVGPPRGDLHLEQGGPLLALQHPHPAQGGPTGG